MGKVFTVNINGKRVDITEADLAKAKSGEKDKGNKKAISFFTKKGRFDLK